MNSTAEQPSTGTMIEFYWRPGCPFCMALRGPLRRSGLPVRELNIWTDPQAAARVRLAADGDETVPTVVVGPRALVNPSMGQVLAAVRDHAPDLAAGATPTTPRWAPLMTAIGFALAWVLLAARSPTNTYHLAPLLVAAAAAVTHRGLTQAPVRSRRAIGLAVSGLVIAWVTTAVLAWRGMLAGPDVTGGHGAVVESVLLALLGSVLGWWVARRHARDMPD
jgi:glutaredoxin